jgi:hypothetical protein
LQKKIIASLAGNSWATLSNCGEFLKLLLPSSHGNIDCGRVNSPGYGKNAKDATMDNPQPSSKSFFSLKERYECSSQTRWEWVFFSMSATLGTW